MYEFVSVLTIDIMIFVSFMIVILKMIGKSYIDISKCRKRYFDRLDQAFEYDNDGYENDGYDNDILYNTKEETEQSELNDSYDSISDIFNNKIIYTEDVIMSKYIEVLQYFGVERNGEILIDILSGETILTTGFIEDLLNNKDFEYPKEKGEIIEMFNINTEYNRMLNKYGHHYFNYDSKINLIEIGERDDILYYSSLGQLHFYKWFINNVYEYVIAKYM